MPWSSVKQLRTVLETEYSVDDIFDGQIHFLELELRVRSSALVEKVKRHQFSKSKKAEQADGFTCKPFVVTDQNTWTSLYYREVPLPW